MTGAIGDLRREVLGGLLCTACGACVDLCPYVMAVGDRVACIEECRKEDGRCYRYCPRSGADGAEVGLGATGGESSGVLGTVRLVSLARATDASHTGASRAGLPPARQHGGVVTALVVQALRSGVIEEAVLTSGEEGVARPVLVSSEEEVAACARSKFALAPTVAEVNRALNRGARRLGVVAMPCQATALRRMRDDALSRPGEPGMGDGGLSSATQDGAAHAPAAQESPAHRGEQAADGIRLVIGLFCTWALGQQAWSALRKEWLGTSRVLRVDIPPPPANVLVAEVEDGNPVAMPLDEVRLAVRDACRVCADMTAEHADIAVGIAEGDQGWNTVIVRTEAGERLFGEAVAAGALEVCAPREERVAHLEEASLGKKRRAAVEAGDWEGDSPYLVRLREAAKEWSGE